MWRPVRAGLGLQLLGWPPAQCSRSLVCWVCSLYTPAVCHSEKKALHLVHELSSGNCVHTWIAIVSLTMSRGLYRKAAKKAMPVAIEASTVPTSATANER